MKRAVFAAAIRRSIWERRRGAAFVCILGLALACGSGAAPALAANAVADRAFVPTRAPLHLRQAQLDAIGAAFAESLARGEALDREELSMWLRYHGGTLGRLAEVTGIDPKRVIEGAREHADGAGGPFVALGGMAGAADEPAIDMDRLVDQVLATVPLASPVVDAHRLTSGFGKRRDPFRGRLAFHRGLDLAAPRGTPIYAPAAGTVLRAGRLGGFGNIVELDHGNGVVTRYAHLHAYHVRRGDTVEPGQRLGLMGRTGRATGVHLHYEVIVDERHVDPRRFLEMGRQLLSREG